MPLKEDTLQFVPDNRIAGGVLPFLNPGEDDLFDRLHDVAPLLVHMRAEC